MGINRALVCAPTMPEYDREGGSGRIFHLIKLLRQSNWAVSFIAENARNGERYAKTLQQMGVTTYASRDSWSTDADCLIDPKTLIAGGGFDLILVAFWYQGEYYLPLVRSLSPHTRVAVDSIDLHFLRGSRKAFLRWQGDGTLGVLDAQYGDEMIRELNVYSGADAVLTVSQKESELINDFVGDPDLAFVVPDAEDLPISPLSFGDRKGMLLVGNFRHPPNVQAVEYLCKEVVPLIDSRILAEHPIYIVGNGLNTGITDYGKGLSNIHWVGWVPSVLPYFHRARISLVPLLYGAGTKRKLMQSMVAGTPCVSTSIGIEGLDLEHGRHVLVADESSQFADAATDLLTSKVLWQELASQGRNHILATYSPDAVISRFETVISQIMNKPVKRLAAKHFGASA